MAKAKLTARERERLLEAAGQARTRAYAPYSRIRVGAALLTQQGHLFTGVNVENASFGLTICAERAAIAAAVAREGEALRLKALAVLSEAPGPFPPCGACRQVLAEFGPDALIIFQGEDGLQERPLKELLPESFRLPAPGGRSRRTGKRGMNSRDPGRGTWGNSRSNAGEGEIP